MLKAIIKKYMSGVICIICACYSLSARASSFTDAKNAVVKIYSTIQRDNYNIPWQSRAPMNATGTGFVISNKRILTNAHVVSNARFLQVQKDSSSRRYRASVLFIGHDCDLAVLEVDDKSFFDGTTTLNFSDKLPSLNDEVMVVGYPMGGDRLSITKGIVSRIDYSGYTHSGVDQHLALQVDAAINPGNSGGPVLFKDKVVGLAFQGIALADNIGYAIPVPVVKHFIDDIKDSKYHGYPELGINYLTTRNKALLNEYNIKDGQSGIVVFKVDPFGSAKGFLFPGDVLLGVDNHSIASDGSISLNGNNILFAEMLERKQWGDSVVFDTIRKNKTIKVTVPLKNPKDPFIYRNLYDKKPEYFIIGGLVFAPLNHEYLRSIINSSASANKQQLFYYSQYATKDELYKGVDEFVVLIHRLPNQVNAYTDNYINGIVTELNGVKITRLEDLKLAKTQAKGGFHVFKFAGMDDTLVLDAKEEQLSEKTILSEYGVPAPFYFGAPEE